MGAREANGSAAPAGVPGVFRIVNQILPTTKTLILSITADHNGLSIEDACGESPPPLALETCGSLGEKKKHSAAIEKLAQTTQKLNRGVDCDVDVKIKQDGFQNPFKVYEI